MRRQLGAGGMGVVYEVHDRVRREVVALKTLLRARAADIYRLKREFRSLADVAHPNLVSLYELVVEGADCFFTMELVHGVNLVEYVRGSAATAALRAERVRHVFRQLVEGIGALHRKGKLHRDIKPSNILVTPGGRVVILDFGLAGDIVPDDAAIGESMAGTPAYLAPERRAGSPGIGRSRLVQRGRHAVRGAHGSRAVRGFARGGASPQAGNRPVSTGRDRAGRAGRLERHLHGPAAPRSGRSE